MKEERSQVHLWDVNFRFHIRVRVHVHVRVHVRVRFHVHVSVRVQVCDHVRFYFRYVDFELLSPFALFSQFLYQTHFYCTNF